IQAGIRRVWMHPPNRGDLQAPRRFRFPRLEYQGQQLVDRRNGLGSHRAELLEESRRPVRFHRQLPLKNPDDQAIPTDPEGSSLAVYGFQERLRNMDAGGHDDSPEDTPF